MQFDELGFFGKIKKCPGLYLGKKSLINLTHFLAGMRFCADLYTNGSLTDSCIFPYFDKFVTWYVESYVKDPNGYAVWWNHILYTSANNDDLAFDSFFHYFGLYLREQHEIVFPLDIT